MSSSVANPRLDPVSARAENLDLTLNEKIQGLQKILKDATSGMLTTRAENGDLHSRCMIPTSPHSPTQLSLFFLANNASHKFDELKHDDHVNVSFCDTNSTSWASFSGKAHVSQDTEQIKKHWSVASSAWFGDLKDGVHKGDMNDPRVSLIEVKPSEIRYWVSTQSTITRVANIGISAVTGKTASPGELRTITNAEIQLADGLNTK